MKKSIFILFALGALLACKKDDKKNLTPTTDPYAKPWKTEFIRYENLTHYCSSHSSSYKIYYKDSLLFQDCKQFDAITITDTVRIDNSNLFLYVGAANSESYILTTADGGASWKKYPSCFQKVIKTHLVKNDLVYYFTENPSWKINYLLLTGAGKSSIMCYQDSLWKGRHYVNDTGTGITDLDSTVIYLNDTITFVIKFK